jgi:tripartite-type tricarboxylate transporter receptor subunit TctC
MSPRFLKTNRRFALQVLSSSAFSAWGALPALSSIALASEAAGARLDGGVLDPSWPPPRPLEVVVPEGKGGSAESLCKALAPRLKQAFAWTVNYRFRGDESPAEVLHEVTRANIDGASLAYVDNRSLVIDSFLNPGAHFSATDLQPVTWLGTRPYVVCTGRRVIAKGLRDWFARAVERPGVMTFGSGGRGSPGHLAGEAMMLHAGVQVLHVPYANERDAIVAAVANEVQAILLDPVQAMPELRSGRLRALAVTSAHPLEAMREIRTAASQGMKGFEAVRWAGFAMPKGVPATTVSKMHAVLSRAIEDHDTQHDMAKVWWQPVGEGPQAFAAMIRAENERWGSLIKRLGLRAA